MQEKWFVYIIRCKNQELYVGIARDVDHRVALHNKGVACRYTKYRRPVELIYKEEQLNYSSARMREREIKGFGRGKKIELINKDSSD